MKVASIAELEKLYKVNIPVAEEFDYYISTLQKSSEFDFIDRAIFDINHLESNCKLFYNFDSVKAYKLDALDRMIFYIKNTTAFEEFSDEELTKNIRVEKFESVNKTNEFYSKPGLEFVSIDFSSANFNIMKTCDRVKNQLFDSWPSLCKFLNIHDALTNSKSFRQYVFGNLNPKRNQTFQQFHIMRLVRLLKDARYDSRESIIKEDNIVMVTHDEVILKFNSSQECAEKLQALKNYTLIKLFVLPLKFTRFTIETIAEKSKMFVKKIYGDNGYLKYKELFGVPGNQYYYYFKKYILNEPVEKRDLFFRNDNKLAMWVMTPDYQPVATEIIDEVLASDN